MTEGNVQFKVYDEVFNASPNCLVKIPKYAPHSLVALEKSAMYDIGGQTQWFALLQDRESIMKYDAQRGKNPDAMDALKAKFGCLIKSYGTK